MVGILYYSIRPFPQSILHSEVLPIITVIEEYAGGRNPLYLLGPLQQNMLHGELVPTTLVCAAFIRGQADDGTPE